ncbi:MAG TPA: monovalent cation/H(+) antiporter subunit G [Candidatus Sphingobacterium stercoripullorum]|uniref:Monovalent cation/H(+) antiporter subunit G n=1 Tax=Candidatus Sphingobacterium stercoripullorum TaxID=2838759 RepID=A0A9D1WAK0_9SPHI|nr:monovalent cation/H(+) antiporter subunit G [Candidatus Sphingobacterium stercoripullorum]
MTETIVIILSSIGSLSILFAGIGVLRMPDFYLRLSVTVKAATMGVGIFLLCAALLSQDISVVTKAIAVVFFIVLTAPIAAHMIAKAGYFTNTPLWEGTVTDDLRNDYQKEKPVDTIKEEDVEVLEEEDR